MSEDLRVTPDDEEHGGAGFRVSWGGLSLSLAILAIGSLATLAVIVAVKDVDVLATVALALAVLSFAAQLVVTLLQAQASGQQLSAIDRIASETRGVLSQIDARSSALLSNQSDQFDRVLSAALGPDALRRAVQEATPEDGAAAGGDSSEATSPIDLAALEANLEASVKRALREERRQALRGPSAFLPQRRSGGSVRRPSSHRAFVEALTTFPSQVDGEKALATLNALNPREVSLLVSRAQSDLSRARAGSEPEGRLKDDFRPTPAFEHLLALGLFEVSEKKKNGSIGKYRRLTPAGVDVARLLLTNGPPPEWLTFEP